MSDWNIFLRRIKLLEFIAIFIAALIFTGMMLIFSDHIKFAPAMVIYLMSVFIDYIFTIGIMMLQADGGNSKNRTNLLRRGITLFIMLFSAYKFCSLFNNKIYVFPLYAALWFIYIMCKRRLFKVF